jgi:hypothetical protein
MIPVQASGSEWSYRFAQLLFFSSYTLRTYESISKGMLLAAAECL